MTMIKTVTITCPCGSKTEVGLFDSVNVTLDPTLKQELMDRKINSFKCEKCGFEQELLAGFLYHDMKNQIYAWVLKQSDRGNQELADKLLNSFQNMPPSMRKRLEKVPYLQKPSMVYGYDELFALIKSGETE